MAPETVAPVLGSVVEGKMLSSEERELAMTELAIEPAFDTLRPDSRFQNLLRRVGLAK